MSIQSDVKRRASEQQKQQNHAYSWWVRTLRTQLQKRIERMTSQHVVIHDALGMLDNQVNNERPTIRIDVSHPNFYRLLASNGSVGAAEAYMDGAWTCDDLVGLIALLVRHRDVLDEMHHGLARLSGWAMKRLHALRENTLDGAKRNIAAHYDLGNDFFDLFLSDDLMYSSALFANQDMTLDEASQHKLATICDKLQLSADDHVVEIGTGWGGFALYAAKHTGCRVTTTTISEEQYALAKQRVDEAGLSEQITMLKSDYRDLTGQYDKLVSIEMIEAIGEAYLPTYLQVVERLLKPNGLALIQAITIEDHRYERAVKSVDFIKRYVFPGSFIPSINAIMQAKTQATQLALVGLEDFGGSYAETLKLWRERFLAQLDVVRAQGFDEHFIRMWDFYFAYCEGGFRERSIGVSHLLFANGGAQQAPLRWQA